jgi:ABC-type branched-subunit amino acid transport system substrate-binding protein
MRVRVDSRNRGLGAVVAGMLAIALVAAGCSANSTGTTTATNSVAPTSPGATTTTVPGNGPGVTATTIKLGIAMINFDCIKAFVDTAEPKQQAGYQAFISDINDHGGINGRKIEPVFKSVCPIGPTEGLAACTAFSDDDNVFAVVGEFGQITADVPLCVTKQHNRPLITYGLTQDMIDKAPPGLLLTPDILPDRRVKIIASLLKTQHTLDGKTVAVLADSESSQEVDQIVAPALTAIGIKQVSPSIVTISGSDTTAALAQVDSFIERWKTEHVNALFLAGDAVESKQFVAKIRAALPDVPIVADSTGILSGAQDDQKAHVSPNPYDGMITAEGLTGVQHAATANGKFCRATFTKYTHIAVPAPDVVVKLANGQQNDIQTEAGDPCALVEMFNVIAQRVGKNLNIANWVSTVNNFGAINVYATTYASLHAGKYDADDTYGLVAYDPTVGDAGDWKQLTPVRDVSGE